jgi:HPt (histidine-containing phosphotransfer) domain-containing protein
VTAEIASANVSEEILDINGALGRMEGDRELLEEVARLFLNECPKMLDGIRQASAAQDARVFERLAHTVKGSSANIGARALSQVAAEMEKQARSGDLHRASRQIERLAAEMDRLRSEIDSLFRKVTHG